MSLFRRRPPASPSGIEPQMAHFEGEAARALETLVEANAALSAVLPAQADLAQGYFLAETDTLIRSRDRLARLLVASMVGASGAPLPRELQEERGLVEEVTRTLVTGWQGARKLRKSDPQHALGEAGVVLREFGLEEHTLDVLLAQDREGRFLVVWHAVPPETAHVWLLGNLYERIEASLILNSLLTLERQASRWWFQRWTTRKKGEEMDFTRTVREQEWSLVERETLQLGTPVMAAVPEQPFFAEIPRRQQQMARALARSHVGVFEVRERRDHTTILESLPAGRSYEVHEHNPEHVYQAGFLAIGRLIPFEGVRYLRSPGMVIFGSSPGRGAKLAEIFAQLREALSPAIAAEVLIARTVSAEAIPRTVPPAASRAEAQSLLKQLQSTLESEGLAERPPIEEAPEEIRAALAGTDNIYMTFEVDEEVLEWMQALSKMAGPGGTGGGKTEKKEGNKSKKKGKKRRG